MHAIRAIAILSALLIGGCSIADNPAVPSRGSPFVARARQRSKEIVMDTFTSPTYGNSLPSPLTPDGAGNYYGTTSVGGEGYGTIYELSPSGKGGWNETTLHTFEDYLDGGFPELTPLIFDKRGDLYGTTHDGGQFEFGTAFRLHHTAKRWVETILHNFGNGNAYPFNSLVMDRAGNLYGTDNVYHDGGGITEGVYEINPSSSGWKFRIIYDLGMAAANGASGGLVVDPQGNIFGISSGFIGKAIAFELKPIGSGWSPSILFTFKEAYPLGAPVLDKAGNIYDTTGDGGPAKHGTVFELSPLKTGSWKLKTLYAFKGGADGGSPYSGVAFDATGNIYGTTLGGALHLGNVFELKAGSYSEKVLWTFYGRDGSTPLAPVVLDSAGNVFGTTSAGGGEDPNCYAAKGCGNAFEITP